MRNKLAYLAPFIVAASLCAFGQRPTETNTKKSEAQGKNAKGKGAEADKPTDKTGGLKFGVPTESEKLLDAAIAKVESIKKFHADVRQKTEMLGYTFTAEGQYAIEPDFRMLYELKVQLTNDTTGWIKEVCDGRWH